MRRIILLFFIVTTFCSCVSHTIYKDRKRIKDSEFKVLGIAPPKFNKIEDQHFYIQANFLEACEQVQRVALVLILSIDIVRLPAIGTEKICITTELVNSVNLTTIGMT